MFFFPFKVSSPGGVPTNIWSALLPSEGNGDARGIQKLKGQTSCWQHAVISSSLAHQSDLILHHFHIIGLLPFVISVPMKAAPHIFTLTTHRTIACLLGWIREHKLSQLKERNTLNNLDYWSLEFSKAMQQCLEWLEVILATFPFPCFSDQTLLIQGVWGDQTVMLK